MAELAGETGAVVGRTLPGEDDDDEVSVAVTGQMVVETVLVSCIHHESFASLTGNGLGDYRSRSSRTVRNSWRTACDSLERGTVDRRGAVLGGVHSRSSN